MKSVLISIQPKWCALIACGKKTIEVRKTAPKLQTPFKCFIYCTRKKMENENLVLTQFGYDTGRQGAYCNWIGNSNCKIIGGFVCDRIDEFHEWQLSPGGKFQEFEQRDLEDFLKSSCLSYEEVCAYRQNMPYFKPLYGWHISDLKIYHKTKELYYFSREIGRDKNVIAYSKITRPPQSWRYVEE